MGNSALIEELERQFGDNPQRVFARLASEYRKAGDLARAIELCPENLIALRQLGDIAHARGDIAGARSWYTRLLDVDPQNEEVVAQLAALDNPSASPPRAPAPAKPEPSPEAEAYEAAARSAFDQIVGGM